MSFLAANAFWGFGHVPALLYFSDGAPDVSALSPFAWASRVAVDADAVCRSLSLLFAYPLEVIGFTGTPASFIPIALTPGAPLLVLICSAPRMLTSDLFFLVDTRLISSFFSGLLPSLAEGVCGLFALARPGSSHYADHYF